MDSKQPRTRFCACDQERFKKGRKVYLKERGVLTTNQKEGSSTIPVGSLDSNGCLILTPAARFALSLT